MNPLPAAQPETLATHRREREKDVLKNRVRALLATMGVISGLLLAGPASSEAAPSASDKGESCKPYRVDSDRAVLCRNWNDHGDGDGYYDGEYWVKSAGENVYPAVKIDGVVSYFSVQGKKSYQHKRHVLLAMCNLRTCTDFL